MTKQLVLMASEPNRATTHGRLDETTKELGRQGVREARAALAAASLRADARDEARRERRDRELAERATAAGRRSAHAA